MDPLVVAAVLLSIRRLAGSGLPDPPPPTATLPALHDYWSRAIAIVGEDLALRIADDLPAGALGLASYTTMTQPSLAGALHALSDTYLERMVPGMKLRLLPDPDDGAIDLKLVPAETDPLIPLLEEIVIAILHEHLGLLARRPTVRSVAFRRPPPSDPAPWQARFGVMPSFASAATVLRLEATDLAIELRTASPEVQSVASTADARLDARLRSAIRSSLATDFTIESVAASLDLSERTLQRRLQDSGTSWRELVAQIRIDVARDMLEHGDATIAEIASAVGFARPASFSRAFTDAVGESPATFRKRLARR